AAEGHVGWAECVAPDDPSYSSETVDTAWHVLERFVLPDLPGLEVEAPADVMAPSHWIRGHRMARAAVEMAAWDLVARVRGEPLRHLLGADLSPVPVGISIGLQPRDDDLLRRIESALEEGYRRIKLKIRPGRDVEMLREVRRRFPRIPLMADANSAYTLDDTPRLQEMDEFGLLMVEQPLGHEDLLDHAALQALLETPICLDESIRSEADARLALALGAGQILNVKPGRVGGLGESLRLEALWRREGAGAWVGGMLETGVGRAHNVALAGLPGFDLPGDLSASRRYWARDITDPEWELEDGHIRPLDRPGIGVVPDEDRIAGLAVRQLRLPEA
ncbi:MAG: o-succinylbenzoate synthase, partial [Gemmatimonadales bacterium]